MKSVTLKVSHWRDRTSEEREPLQKRIAELRVIRDAQWEEQHNLWWRMREASREQHRLERWCRTLMRDMREVVVTMDGVNDPMVNGHKAASKSDWRLVQLAKRQLRRP